MKKPEKPCITQSSLTMYERCGEQWRRRWRENQIIPPGIALVKGSGVHGGSKANFSQKIESHEDLPKKDIVDIAVSEFDQLTKKGIRLTPEEKTIGHKNVVGQAKDSVVVLSGLYADCVAPEYQPRFVEEEHLLEIPNASHNLMTHMDLADVRDIIADLKTTKKKKSPGEVDNSEQLSFYALAFNAITGRLPSAVRLEVLIDKTKPERQMLESTRTMEDINVIIARINAMIKGLKTGTFMPALATSWQCDPRYCGYAPTCRYYCKR